MNGWVTLVLVAVFGAVGVVIRYGMILLFVRVFKSSSAIATLIINMTGAFAIGLVNARTFPSVGATLSSDWSVVIKTGMLGGFTTFSGFSLDTFQLISSTESTDIMLGVLNLIFAPIVGVLLTFAANAIASAK